MTFHKMQTALWDADWLLDDGKADKSIKELRKLIALAEKMIHQLETPPRRKRILNERAREWREWREGRAER